MIRCLSLLASVAGLFLFVGVSPARACGGTFCDLAQPVNQSAEQIIFARHDDGTVTAVIRIQYQGPGERFAWLLPVAGEPDVAVSSSAVFDALNIPTAPVYQMTFDQEGTCRNQVRQRPCPEQFSNSGGGGGGGAVFDGGLAFAADSAPANADADRAPDC